MSYNVHTQGYSILLIIPTASKCKNHSEFMGCTRQVWTGLGLRASFQVSEVEGKQDSKARGQDANEGPGSNPRSARC